MSVCISGPYSTRVLCPQGFSRQEHWSGLPCPPPGDLPHPGIKPVSLRSPALVGDFFTTSATWEALPMRAAARKGKEQLEGILSFSLSISHTPGVCPTAPGENSDEAVRWESAEAAGRRLGRPGEGTRLGSTPRFPLHKLSFLLSNVLSPHSSLETGSRRGQGGKARRGQG